MISGSGQFDPSAQQNDAAQILNFLLQCLIFVYVLLGLRMPDTTP